MKTSTKRLVASILREAAAAIVSAKVVVPTKGLPDVVRKALKEVGYNKSDISISPATTYSLQDMGGEGRRAFNILVNLKTERYEVTWGSWGGPGLGSRDNLTDLDDTNRPLPDGIVHIRGSEGGNSPTYASIMVNPSTMAPMLPAATEELSDQEQMALNVINGITSSYRAGYFRDNKLGEYSAKNPLILSLAKKGLLKVTSNGAVSVTTAGKNAAKRVM